MHHEGLNIEQISFSDIGIALFGEVRFAFVLLRDSILPICFRRIHGVLGIRDAFLYILVAGRRASLWLVLCQQ